MTTLVTGPLTISDRWELLFVADRAFRSAACEVRRMMPFGGVRTPASKNLTDLLVGSCRGMFKNYRMSGGNSG